MSFRAAIYVLFALTVREMPLKARNCGRPRLISTKPVGFSFHTDFLACSCALTHYIPTWRVAMLRSVLRPMLQVVLAFAIVVFGGSVRAASSHGSHGSHGGGHSSGGGHSNRGGH